MITLSATQAGPRTPEGLAALLQRVREAARADDHPKLLSISLRVDHIDPLAVLQSIYDPAHLHYYCELPAEEMAIAGAEAVVSHTASGANRFASVKAFAEEILDHTWATGDLDTPLTGPNFFCAFTFDPDDNAGTFPPATVFVPTWQVSSQGGNYGAVANVYLHPDMPIEPVAQRIWAAYRKFEHFDYGEERARVKVERYWDFKGSDADDERYEAAVAKALEIIRSGDVDKIVLERQRVLNYPRPLHPLDAIESLRAGQTFSYSFSFANGGEETFIGATPEMLAQVDDGQLQTEALAGSATSMRDSRKDAKFSSELLSSEKDQREHQFVVDSIQRRLGALGISIKHDPRPVLRKFSGVQHLRTPITAQIPSGIHILDIVDALHPTAAVGGVPREKALPHIRELEGFDRGLYAGPMGWFDVSGNGRFTVSLRSALIRGNLLTAFGGAGIVKGSVPSKEFAETEAKIASVFPIWPFNWDVE